MNLREKTIIAFVVIAAAALWLVWPDAGDQALASYVGALILAFCVFAVIAASLDRRPRPLSKRVRHPPQDFLCRFPFAPIFQWRGTDQSRPSTAFICWRT